MAIIERNVWHSWNGILNKYKFRESKCGPGEFPAACVLGSKPEGQNKSYDLQQTKYSNISEFIEVKNIDKDLTFKLGVSSSHGFSKVVHIITRIFEKIEKLKNMTSEDSSFHTIIEKIYNETFMDTIKRGRTSASLYKSFLKSEVISDKINRTDNVITTLLKLINEAYTDEYDGFDVLKGYKTKYKVSDIFRMLYNSEEDNAEIIELIGVEKYTIELIKLKLKKDLELFQEESLFDKLNVVIQEAISHVDIMLVDEVKGYCFINKDQISFCRVTHGRPRCVCIGIDT
jgi:hypothetical protein